MTRLLDWIIGREPVAAATGIAAVVTALAGVLTAFDMVVLSAEQIAAVGALTAAVAGWAARGAVTPVAGPTERQDRGSIPLALIILVALAVVLLAGLAVCTDAAFEDEDEVNDLGMPALVVDHDCYEYGDCGGRDEYGDGRGGYSGGPSGGYYEGGKGGSDYDGDGDGNRCRNFCFYGIPAPGEGGQR
jgi:hypothetical protein